MNLNENLQEQLDATNKKLEMTEKLLVESDEKLAMYESIGTIEEITDFLDKVQASTAIHEYMKYESCNRDKDCDNCDDYDDDDYYDDDEYDDDDLIDEDFESKKKKCKGKKEMNNNYSSMIAQLRDDNEELSEKCNELMESLDEYESLGTPTEIAKQLSLLNTLTIKSESEELAKKFNINLDHATEIRLKTESIEDAYKFLSLMDHSNESSVKFESVDASTKTETKITSKNESKDLAKLRQILLKL